MDFLDELESMAVNISPAEEEDTSPSISEADAARWEKLFGYTPSEAVLRIENYRDDFTRLRISEDLWTMLRATKEAEGHDRESYEYSLLTIQQASGSLAQHAAPPPPPRRTTFLHPRGDNSGRFIVQLTTTGGPLGSPEKIKEAAGLSALPTTTSGTGDDGQTAHFCEIDGLARARLLAWCADVANLQGHHPLFRPMIIRLATRAKKDLDVHSIAPSLGLDATMPQHRLSSSPVPTQDEYPVWYFFYGTLADPTVLTRHLALTEPPVLVPASVRGGRLKTWGGKYKALVDDAQASVSGGAFLVRSREHEDALRFYETDKYEVVRCRIFMDDDTGGGGACLRHGLTFRFAAAAVQDLD